MAKNIYVQRQLTLECGSCNFCSTKHNTVNIIASKSNMIINMCDDCLLELKEVTKDFNNIKKVKIKSNILSGDDSYWWYRNLHGKSFNVRECKKTDYIIGLGHCKKEELYIINDGKYVGNAIVKEHCEKI